MRTIKTYPKGAPFYNALAIRKPRRKDSVPNGTLSSSGYYGDARRTSIIIDAPSNNNQLIDVEIIPNCKCFVVRTLLSKKVYMRQVFSTLLARIN
jgi:hypothetical protein